MKRVIIDYKKLSADQRQAFSDLYSEGYGDNELMTLTMGNGTRVSCLPLTFEDISFLVKIGSVSKDFWDADFLDSIEPIEGVDFED
jgi:hypothetical protein